MSQKGPMSTSLKILMWKVTQDKFEKYKTPLTCKMLD